MKNAYFSSVLAVLLMGSGAAHAIQDCSLNGESVNPANGHTTNGKTGLMRCTDRDSGQLVREQELQNGRFMGIERFFKDGKLQRERSVNERGNSHGLAREFAPDGKLLRESTYDNGSEVGLARSNHANGALERVTFYANRSEQASAEFTRAGQLRGLRCGDKPLLAPLVDDAKFCGFTSGNAPPVELFNEAGVLQARLRYAGGQLQKRDELYANGQPARVDEVKDGTRTERRFAEDGALRREIVWQLDGKSAFKTVEKEFSDKGSLIRDQRWTDRKLTSDSSFYLNGQPKSRSLYGREGEAEVVDVTEFHDNGQPARTGRYGAAGHYERIAMGRHQAFDAAGKLVAESVYDARGRISRERAWDDSGKLLRDDEVFEDGSRKAYAK